MEHFLASFIQIFIIISLPYDQTLKFLFPSYKKSKTP